MKKNFPVASYRVVPNPYQGRKDEYGEIAETEMVMMMCNINDLPSDLPTETNPRQQNMNTNVAKKIQDSLIDSEFNDFHLLNRGILVSAQSVSINLKTKVVEIDFRDNAIHGIVDGGHTYRAIIENRQFVEEKKYVKIELLTGIENIFERLAGARNTSVQVKDKSLAELENKFSLIKNGLRDEPFADSIAYKENENLHIMIDDVISILNMFDIERYSESVNPVPSYSSKGRCIKNYLENYNNYGETESNPYYKMKNIMGDIFSLFSKLEKDIGDLYIKSLGERNGKFGRTKGVETANGKKKYYGMITNKEIKYKTPKSFLYPILAAFRALVVEDNGQYRFVLNPQKALDAVGPELVRLTVERCRSLGNNPNAVGKDINHWSQLYDKVDLYRLKNIQNK